MAIEFGQPFSVDDDEAYELWKQYVPQSRICRFDEADNYWEMGETGPCGPCSELYYDPGGDYGAAATPYEDEGGDRFLEFWNLVFMQSNRSSEGQLTPLPRPSVDTGAGIERVVALKMGVDTVFETDILGGLVDQVQEVLGRRYDGAAAFHVIADHLRTLAFAIADGAQPGNVDRGYVLRKVLRRALRYGRQLGANKPFMALLLPRLVALMGSDYRELVVNQERIAEILTTEEEAFLRTLRRGGSLLSQVIEDATSHGRTISGEEAFKLKDTYGLPLEEIALWAKDANLSVDTAQFDALEMQAKERSRQAHKATQQVVEENVFMELAARLGESHFTGYEATEGEGKVTAIVVNGQEVEEVAVGQKAIVLLDQTPFYAEKGGQVGDVGTIVAAETCCVVNDCRAPYNGVVAHIYYCERGVAALRYGSDHSCGSLPPPEDCQQPHGDPSAPLGTAAGTGSPRQASGFRRRRWTACVSTSATIKRSVMKNCGGSKISLTAKCVGMVLWQATASLTTRCSSRAISSSFFGDKYGAIVRVVDIDGESKELCGGTHTDRVGTIGFFQIVKEESIAAGVRRIQAVTGAAAEAAARSSDEQLAAIGALVKTAPHKLYSRLEKIVEEIAALKRENARLIREVGGAACRPIADSYRADWWP